MVIGLNGQEITKVPPAINLKLACKTIQLEWLDGMAIVFNFPLKEVPDTEDVTLSDGE